MGENYERDVYTFEESFGTIGGLYGIVTMVAYHLLTPFMKDWVIVEIS